MSYMSNTPMFSGGGYPGVGGGYQGGFPYPGMGPMQGGWPETTDCGCGHDSSPPSPAMGAPMPPRMMYPGMGAPVPPGMMYPGMGAPVPPGMMYPGMGAPMPPKMDKTERDDWDEERSEDSSSLAYGAHAGYPSAGAQPSSWPDNGMTMPTDYTGGSHSPVGAPGYGGGVPPSDWGMVPGMGGMPSPDYTGPTGGLPPSDWGMVPGMGSSPGYNGGSYPPVGVPGYGGGGVPPSDWAGDGVVPGMGMPSGDATVPSMPLGYGGGGVPPVSWSNSTHYGGGGYPPAPGYFNPYDAHILQDMYTQMKLRHRYEEKALKWAMRRAGSEDQDPSADTKTFQVEESSHVGDESSSSSSS